MRVRTTYEDWAAVLNDHANPVASAIALARSSSVAVVRGAQIATFLCGATGLGKTKAINDALATTSVKPIRANPATFRELAEVAQKCRGKAPLVIEEGDVIFRTPNMFNVLKRICETNRRDRVYNGKRVEAPLLVSTNDDLSDVTRWPADLRHHHQALFSRIASVYIPGHDREAVWEYVVAVAITTKLLWEDQAGNGVPLAARNEALKFFTHNLWTLKVVSARTLKNIASDLCVFKGDPTLPTRLEGYLDRSLPPGRVSPCPTIVRKLEAA